MSKQYDQYLKMHKENVTKGFEWLEEKLPHLIRPDLNTRWHVTMAHDSSKTDLEEYDAYDKYFYGRNRSYSVVQNFNRAWLHHIHHNPHHWQHWILINDDPKNGDTCLEMPHNYVIEMICDWWAFSWQKGNLYEIFNWYNEHKDYIKFHNNTRKLVESILAQIKEQLQKETKDEQTE